MQHIKLTSKANEEDWSMRFVDNTDYDTLIEEDTTVYKPDGSLLFVVLKKATSPGANARAYSVLKKINMKTENRSTASGIEAQPRVKKDGTVSKVTRVPKGWEVISGVIGFFERTVRMPYAHACSWNQQNPQLFSKLFPLCEEVSRLFEKHVPERFSYQKSVVEKTPSDYIIPGTVFTTLTVNKNFRTSCHKDAGDLEHGFSCMSVFTEGQFMGANLVFPNYRVAAKLEDGDLILFDPHEFHGNTQLIPLTKNYVRCSVVYYFREKLQYCSPPKEELERVKNRKQGESLYD